MYDGSVHDFVIFKDVFIGFDFSRIRLYVDLGFLGIKKVVNHDQLFIPYKASKNRPLTEAQKKVNSIYASIRVRAENTIAKLKSFFVLRIENRMTIKPKLNKCFHLCSMLAIIKVNSLKISK